MAAAAAASGAAGSEPSASDLVSAVFAAFESFKQRYGEMERSQLAQELGQLDLRGAGKVVTGGGGQRGQELSETVKRIEVRGACGILPCAAALDRAF